MGHVASSGLIKVEELSDFFELWKFLLWHVLLDQLLLPAIQVPREEVLDGFGGAEVVLQHTLHLCIEVPMIKHLI
eukprot:Skav207531  [mRNA]  locus=scaffold756:35501:37491:+ [translate_table: standard]